MGVITMETNMKINLITGGSRGLGRSMALHLAQKGQDSIITYHTKKADADAVVKEIQALGQKAVALQQIGRASCRERV